VADDSAGPRASHVTDVREGQEDTDIGRRLHEDARSRLHHVARGLLQRRACRITAVHN